jgi:hypothetical protein
MRVVKVKYKMIGDMTAVETRIRSLILLVVFLVLTINIFSQHEMIFQRKKEDFYYGQWYVIKKQPNTIFLVDTPQNADDLFLGILEEEGLNPEDIDTTFRDGLRMIESDAGYGYKTIYMRIAESYDEVILVIRMEPVMLQSEEVEPWYSLFSSKEKFKILLE